MVAIVGERHKRCSQTSEIEGSTAAADDRRVVCHCIEKLSYLVVVTPGMTHSMVAPDCMTAAVTTESRARPSQRKTDQMIAGGTCVNLNISPECRAMAYSADAFSHGVLFCRTSPPLGVQHACDV